MRRCDLQAYVLCRPIVDRTRPRCCTAGSPIRKYWHWSRRDIECVLLGMGNDMSKLYDIEMTSITGEPVSFSEFRDEALLIVNLASQ